MTYTVTKRRRLSLGTLNGELLTIDVTSYTTAGEDLSASKLGTPKDPLIVLPVFTEFNLGARWDKTNNKLLLFYPLAQHAHDLLVTGGQAAGAALQIEPDSAAAVLGKQAATNRTLAAGTPIQNKTAAAGGQLATADDGGTIDLLVLYEGS